VIFGLILALASAVATNLAFLFKQRGAVVAPPIGPLAATGPKGASAVPRLRSAVTAWPGQTSSRPGPLAWVARPATPPRYPVVNCHNRRSR
jgi:hypothetical protein